MANLVTSEKILPLIEPAIKDVDVDIEQNDTKNLVVRFTTPDRISLRPAVEQILTDNNIGQSLERSGGKYGNKGEDSALSALKLIASIGK